MKCVHCGRPLQAAAVTIATRRGPVAYGPKCARTLGIALGTRAKPRRRLAEQPGAHRRDQFTRDLFAEAAA